MFILCLCLVSESIVTMCCCCLFSLCCYRSKLCIDVLHCLIVYCVLCDCVIVEFVNSSCKSRGSLHDAASAYMYMIICVRFT